MTRRDRTVARGGYTLLCLSSMVLLSVACREKRTVDGSSIHGSGQAEGSGVRMALRAVSAKQFPEVSFSEFMGKGILGAPSSQISVELPGRVLEAFAPSFAVQIFPLEGSVLRRDVVAVRSRVPRVSLKEAARSLPLSLNLSAGASIEVVRPFRSSSEAGAADPFDLMNLPLNAERALALTTGTYVGIPVTGSVGLEVNGSFLSRSALVDSRLWDFVRAGAVGSMSGAMQGMLIASGKWRMQVVRLDGSKVRLRVVEDDAFSVGVGVGASARPSFVYVPGGVMDRAIDISQRTFAIAQGVERRVSALEAVASKQKLPLSLALQRAEGMAASLGVKDSTQREKIQAALGKDDNAVSLAESSGQSPAALRASVAAKVDAALAQASADLKTVAEPLHEVMRRFADRAFDVSGSVKLSAEFAKKHRLIADYVFDLSSDEARFAFEHAVSGRSLWLGATPSVTDMASGLINFAVAERLAAEDTGKPQARVVRNMIAEGTMRERALSIRFSGLFASTGFSESWRNNRAWARDSSGREESWQASLWQFDRDVNLFRSNTSERLGSGILVPGNASSSDLGTYWFLWRKRLPDGRASAMQGIFSEAVNLLGPYAFVYGLPGMYKGEFSGDKDASLLVTFSRPAIAAFFDPARVSNALLWRALGNVAETFDNTFGLPFNTFGGLPSEWSAVPEAVSACEKVSKAWGASYCSYFAKEFIGRMELARRSSDSMQRMKVFEAFYSKGFLANKIGARLLVRYMLEVMTLAFGKDAPAQMQFMFSVRNAKNNSDYASPSISAGGSSEIEVLQSLGLVL